MPNIPLPRRAVKVEEKTSSELPKTEQKTVEYISLAEEVARNGTGIVYSIYAPPPLFDLCDAFIASR